MRFKLLSLAAQAVDWTVEYDVARARLRFHSPKAQTSWCEPEERVWRRTDYWLLAFGALPAQQQSGLPASVAPLQPCSDAARAAGGLSGAEMGWA